MFFQVANRLALLLDFETLFLDFCEELVREAGAPLQLRRKCTGVLQKLIVFLLERDSRSLQLHHLRTQ